MEIIKGTKITLLEFMKLKKFKNFKLLRLHVHNDWNSQNFMDNNHLKWLLDWENKEYIGDEHGNTILTNGYYIGEYDNYIVWNATPFDNKHICLNLMITPMRKEWYSKEIDTSTWISTPTFTHKLPEVNSETNILFGNGITLEILKDTKYKNDYLTQNIISRSLNTKVIEEFFLNKLKLKLLIHDEKCNKNNINLPLVDTINRNKKKWYLSLWKETLDAYKYNLIQDINNEELINCIKINKKHVEKKEECFLFQNNINFNYKDFNQSWINNHICNSENEFKKQIWQLQRANIFGENTYEILSHYLEGEINSRNIDLLERRLKNQKNDFESWFGYSSIVKDILTFLIIQTSKEDSSINKEKYRILMSDITKNLINIFKDEEYMKFFLIFAILNYNEETKSFRTLDYTPPENKVISKIINNANKVMTLNYDNFLEKISQRNDIYHLHGRIDCFFNIEKNKLTLITKDNIHEHYLKILELLLMGLSPRAKRRDYFFYDYSNAYKNDNDSKFFKSKTEYEKFIHSQQLLGAHVPRKKDGINLSYINLDENKLISELLKFNKFTNKKIILLGINPLGDLSYIKDLICNYDEIYIGYYSSSDRENLFQTILNLFDYICNPINSFYFPNMSVARNRLLHCKFHYFDSSELYESFK